MRKPSPVTTKTIIAGLNEKLAEAAAVNRDLIALVAKHEAMIKTLKKTSETAQVDAACANTRAYVAELRCGEYKQAIYASIYGLSPYGLNAEISQLKGRIEFQRRLSEERGKTIEILTAEIAASRDMIQLPWYDLPGKVWLASLRAKSDERMKNA